MTFRVFIGYDEREHDAYDVCKHSLHRFSSIPLDTQRVSFRLEGYDRPWRMKGNQRYDVQDGKPFSTEFSFARFMVPHLMNYEGWALFVDCDFLFRADVAELQSYIDPEHAVSVVRHAYDPAYEIKMDAQKQERYSRKNWSSLILWNCGHPENKMLTLDAVNKQTGNYLHNFGWLKNESIGRIPLEWNWLEGEYPRLPRPKAIHFTNGGPWLKGWNNVGYAGDWLAEKNLMLGRRVTARDSNVA